MWCVCYVAAAAINERHEHRQAVFGRRAPVQRHCVRSVSWRRVSTHWLQQGRNYTHSLFIIIIIIFIPLVVKIPGVKNKDKKIN